MVHYECRNRVFETEKCGDRNKKKSNTHLWEEKMMVSVKQIAEKFSECYRRLYDGEFPRSIERCLCDMGDELRKTRSDINQALADYRKDYLTSDREVAAFAMALYELMLV